MFNVGVYDAADGKNVVNDHHPHSNEEAACFEIKNKVVHLKKIPISIL